MNYLDHFSSNSTNYLSFRPTYPKELYLFLKNLIDNESKVWDCGTGNGQAAYALAKQFNSIIATDRSFSQLAIAKKSSNILYVCCPAEKTPLEDNSIGLITIAQALHWFHFDDFYKEVKRVGSKGGYIAAWCYSLSTVNSKIDAISASLYHDLLGSYWAKERKYIDEEYKTIPFPFERIECPSFYIKKKISLFDYLGYLNSWSAVKEYEKREGKNPLAIILGDLQVAWGKMDEKLEIIWPVHLIVGRV